MQTARVIEVLACTQTDEAVMGLAMLLLDEMHVVGSYEFDVILACKLYQILVHLLLSGIGVVGGIGLVGLVTLHLEVEVVAKEVLEPAHGLFCLFDVALHDFLRYLATNAGRAAYQTLVILFQHIMVDTGVIEIAVGECYRTEFAEVKVALLVLGEQYEMPTATVGDTFTTGLGVALFDVGILVI